MIAVKVEAIIAYIKIPEIAIKNNFILGTHGKMQNPNRGLAFYL